MSESWDLPADKKHELVLSGLSAEQLTELTEKRKEAYEEIKTLMYGEDAEAAKRHFYDRYGFEHVCTCVNDKFTGNVVDNVPVCTLEMGDKALEHLSKVLQERDMLAETVLGLRDQVVELGGEI